MHRWPVILVIQLVKLARVLDEVNPLLDVVRDTVDFLLVYTRRTFGKLQQLVAEDGQLLLGLAVLETRQPYFILNQLITETVLVLEQLSHELESSLARLWRQVLGKVIV